MKHSSLPIVGTLLALGLLGGCDDDDDQDSTPATTELEHQLGYTGTDNVASVPASVNVGFAGTNAGSVYDIADKLPPIGDQGNYGTCVAWAVAYNAKTAAEAIERRLTAAQLSLPVNQLSPADLFMALPSNQKGASCNGTNFESALSLLQSRGCATMQTAPYSQLGCSVSVPAAWTAEAQKHKIKSYRRIGASVAEIKQNIRNHIPVIAGVRLADNFMSWNTNNVLTSNTSYTRVGQHAYHAVTICGFDDAKGPNGAFRIVNSWGNRWGSNGYIWVDYQFFVNEFCRSQDGQKPLFIEISDAGNVTPPAPTPSPTPTPGAGVDVAAWVFTDLSTAQTTGLATTRTIDFNVYNIGATALQARDNWGFYFLYYNAYNAQDYGVIFYDLFSGVGAPNTYTCPTVAPGFPCRFNYTINPGSSFAATVFGRTSIQRTYAVPPLNGYYYLVMVADGANAYSEQNEMNNVFYTTQAPKQFRNGFSNRSSDPELVLGNFRNPLQPTAAALLSSPYNSAVTKQHPNAYSPQEIAYHLKRELASGALQQKARLAPPHAASEYLRP